MFESANPISFRLTIKGVNQDLPVESFTGTEAINAPYTFRLKVLCEPDSLDMAALLYRPAYLAFADSGHGIHGLVCQAGQASVAGGACHYQITLRPQLALLAHRRHTRIFQQLSVPQIMTRVLREHGMDEPAYAFRLSIDYPRREHCVQYDESNLHFIQRLCEEEGLHYHFQHSRQGHQLLFSDGDFFRRVAPQRYDALATLLPGLRAIKRFGVTVDSHLARDSTRAFGESNQPQLISGHFLPLSGHPRAEWNSLWLLTEIHHQCHQAPQSPLHEQARKASPPSDPGGGTTHRYSNTFHALPWDQRFMTLANHPKPRLQGCQTARVIAHDPALSSWVKVRFNWSQEGQHTQACCWAPVAYGLSRPSQGRSHKLPAVESEVEICFVNGDPDQPLVLGY